MKPACSNFLKQNLRMTGNSRCQIDLSGIIIPAPTPFENNEKQTVHYDMLRQNIRKWEQIPAGLKGYCIGATNSEGPYLTHEEKLSMVKVYKSEVAKNKLILVGTSCETTEETCEFSKAAAEAGADAVFIMPPYYFKSRMTDANIINYFIEVADSVPVPVVIYNASPSTGVDISANVVETLAAHPNIAAIKDDNVCKLVESVDKKVYIPARLKKLGHPYGYPDSNRERHIRSNGRSLGIHMDTHVNFCWVSKWMPIVVCAKIKINSIVPKIIRMGAVVQTTKHLNFSFLASSAGILLPGLQIGCVGSMNGLSAVLGFEVCRLYELVRNKKWDEAIELQKQLLPVDFLIFKQLGPPGLKAAMDMMGYFGGDCRRPFLKVDDETKEKIAHVLKGQKFTKPSE